MTEVLPLHFQHREDTVCYSIPHALWGITNFLLSGSCLHKPRLWLGEILNEIGFVPADRTIVRFTDSAHSSQSCLFLDFSAQNLWDEMEINPA